MRQGALTYVKMIAAILIVAGLSTYAYLQSRRYLEGPVIEIESPQDGSTIAQNPVHIIGKALNVSVLTLDDREISTDTEGRFDEILLLAPDYSIITFRARDRFGRETSAKLELVFKESATTTAPLEASSTVPSL